MSRVCDECRRYVADDHVDCAGDTRATCVAWYCGRTIAAWCLQEIGGTGQRVNLGYCEHHRPREREHLTVHGGDGNPDEDIDFTDRKFGVA